jgi:acyl-homoserine lactone acylase PvdQ
MRRIACGRWIFLNWVLAGTRTVTGAPLLANDMHLGMGLPCIWYENHLAGRDLDVTGVSFPGVPGVIADLGDLRRSLGLLVPGNSGRPGSPHYDDQVPAWFTGEHHPMLHARQDVEQAAKARLLLKPES